MCSEIIARDLRLVECRLYKTTVPGPGYVTDCPAVTSRRIDVGVGHWQILSIRKYLRTGGDGKVILTS